MSNRKFYAILAALTANALLMLVVLLFLLLSEPVTGVSQPLLAPAKAEVPVAPEVASNQAGLLVILLIAGLLGVVGTTTYFTRWGRGARTSSAGLRLIVGQASQSWTELRAGQLRIGRGQDNELQVFDPNVSSCHTLIRSARGRFYLQDGGSVNGTYVDGHRVDAVELNDGNWVKIGDAEFEFRILR